MPCIHLLIYHNQFPSIILQDHAIRNSPFPLPMDNMEHDNINDAVAMMADKVRSYWDLMCV